MSCYTEWPLKEAFIATLIALTGHLQANESLPAVTPPPPPKAVLMSTCAHKLSIAVPFFFFLNNQMQILHPDK